MADLNELLAECLDLVREHGDRGVDMACQRHPEHAGDIRRRIALLHDAGMLDDSPVSAAPRTVPDSLGEFQLIERLGAGGMGVVYRAEQPSLGRHVAIKIVRPELALFPGSRQRFRREVETVARLSHPGIVPVYSVGESGDMAYFAMELIDGKSLADMVGGFGGRSPESLCGADAFALLGGRGPIPTLFAGTWIEFSLRIVRHVADALDHAHRAHVVHRDVKPSNIMLTPTGRVLLLDFGLATSADTLGLTRTGSQLGSLPYMAPEQVRGDAKAVGRRTDVYALGVTLYELLTLRPAFSGGITEDVRQRILDGVPTPIATFHSRVPWDIQTVCATAMDVEAARRYTSAAAFAADVDNLLVHRPIEARRAGTTLRLRRWAQRHPARATALTLGLVSLVAVPVVVAVLTVTERDAALTAERNARRQAYTANIAAAEMSLVALDAKRAKLHLQRANGSGHDFEHRYLALRADQALAVFEAEAWVPHVVDVSPSGDRVMFNDGKVARVVDVESRQLLSAVPCANAQQPCLFGPDGAVVVIDPEGGLSIYENDGRTLRRRHDLGRSGQANITAVEGTTLVCVTARQRSSTVCIADLTADTPARQLDVGHSILAVAAATHAESQWLAILDDAQTVSLWDLRRSARVWSVPRRRSGRSLAFDAAAEHIMVAFRDGTLELLSAATGELQEQLDPRAGPIVGLAFCPTGSMFATGHSSGAVRLWDSATFELQRVLCGHEGLVEHLTFSSDGQRLWSAAVDRTIRVWNPHRDRHRQVLLHPEPGRSRAFTAARDAVFSPDNRFVAVALGSGAIAVWDTRIGERHRTLFQHQRRAQAVAFSGDGRWLVSASADETVVVWDARSFGRQLEYPCRGHRPTTLAVDHDGSHIATADPLGLAVLWDGSTGERLGELEHGEAPIKRLGFAGAVLLGRNAEGTLYAWRATDGSVVGHGASIDELRRNAPAMRDVEVPAGLSDAVRTAIGQAGAGTDHAAGPGAGMGIRSATSADGRRVFTATFAGDVRVWDQHGEPLLTLQSEGPPILAITASPDGQTLVTGSQHGDVLLWRADPAETSAGSSHAASQRKMQQLADELLEQHVTRAAADAGLSELHALTPAQRQQAEQRLSARGEDPARLVDPAALFLTKASKQVRTKNTQRARAATVMAPQDGFCRGSLGVALYLDGEYEQAVESFEQALAMGRDSLRGVCVYHRLFYSLALFRLARLDQARAALAEARSVIDVPQEPKYTGARDWLQSFEERFDK